MQLSQEQSGHPSSRPSPPDPQMLSMSFESLRFENPEPFWVSGICTEQLHQHRCRTGRRAGAQRLQLLSQPPHAPQESAASDGTSRASFGQQLPLRSTTYQSLHPGAFWGPMQGL